VSVAPPLVAVEDLSVAFDGPSGPACVVDRVSFSIAPGEVLALVGESGSGKSMTALALLGLTPPAARIASGLIRFAGEPRAAADRRALAPLRGTRIGMVFQEPMTALNPVLTIGEQIAEGLVRHRGKSWREALAEAVALIGRVGITDPERRLSQYIHELSGGMRQRVMIAIAIACRPRLLVADEPTTALDVTVQAQILALLAELRASEGMGMLFITHDLGVVAAVADRVAVMERGKIVEEGPVGRVLTAPATAYTRLLIDSLPGGRAFPQRAAAAARGGPAAAGESDRPLLSVRGLVKRYPVSRGAFGFARKTFAAVAGVDLEARRGEVLALVGESGSGKTTFGRCALRLVEPSEGEIVFDGTDMRRAGPRAMTALRRRMQIVFQDPFASLNPQRDVRAIVGEAMVVHGLARPSELDDRVAGLLALVGLDPAAMRRKPHAFSGGQRQRIAIARALALEPDLVVADEAVSALDATIRAQIVGLLADLQHRLGLTLLFISHDVGLVRRFADRVAVFYLGRVVEEGAADEVLSRPAHPYTAALIAAEPQVSRPGEPILLPLSGEMPSPADPPSGCAFRTRCPRARDACAAERPPLAPVGAGQRAACWFPL
jgi:peptide/nickel transport system ATP-binding protein